MAYRFKNYVSQYVDPQSVKINEVLRKRYVENFASENMLDKSLQDMLVAAEFEGDVEKANQLKQRIQENAQARADRGDYESLGMDIQRDVAGFYEEYKPLEMNYQAREKDKQAKQEQLSRGLITNEEYESWLDYSMYDKQEDGSYVRRQGIQYDDNGMLDRRSVYQPVGIEATVDYSEEIRKGLQGLKASREGGYTVSGVRPKKDKMGNEVKDEFGNTILIAYDSQGKTIEEITPEQIESVVTSVFRDPKVRAHLNQTGEFATYNLGEQDLNNKIYSRIQEIEGRLSVAGGDSRRKLQEELGDLQKALEGDMSARRLAAKNSVIHGIQDRYMQDTIDARAYRSETGGGYKEEISNEYAIRLRDSLANARSQAKGTGGGGYTPYVATPGQASTSVNPWDGIVKDEDGNDTNKDGVITGAEVREAERIAKNVRLTAVSKVLDQHPTILNHFGDFKGVTEDEQIAELDDYLSNMSEQELLRISEKMAEEENMEQAVIVRDIQMTRQAMLSAREEEEAAREMMSKINADAGFTGTAIAKKAFEAVDFKFSEADFGDMSKQDVAQGVANSIVHKIFKNGAAPDAQVQMIFNDNQSSEPVDFDKILKQLLTDKDKGFGLEDQEATDIVKRAVEINRQLQEAHPREFNESEQYNLTYRLKELGVDDTFISTHRSGSSSRRQINMQFPTLTGESISAITRMVDDFSGAYSTAFEQAAAKAKEGFESNSTITSQFERANRPYEDEDGSAAKAITDVFVGEDLAVLNGLEDVSGNMIITNENGVTSIGDNTISTSKITNVKFTRYIDNTGQARPALALYVNGGKSEVLVDQAQAAAGVIDFDRFEGAQSLESAITGTGLAANTFNRLFVRMSKYPTAEHHVIQLPELSGRGGNWTVEFTPIYEQAQDVAIQRGFQNIKIMKDGEPVEMVMSNGQGVVNMNKAQFVNVMNTVQRLLTTP